MAELLDVQQMLVSDQEPKRMYRWILNLEGIDAFTCRSFSRPSRNSDHITIDYINEKRFYAGKDEWQPLTLTLWDPVENSAAQKVMQKLRLLHDDATGRAGYASFYKQDFTLKLLDGPGNVVEKWTAKGAFFQNVQFGELDFSNSEAVNITVEIRADKWFLEF